MTPARLREMAEHITRVIHKTDSDIGPFYQRYDNKFAFGLQEPYEISAGYLRVDAELRSILASLDGSPTVLDCIVNARERIRGLIDEQQRTGGET